MRENILFYTLLMTLLIFKVPAISVSAENVESWINLCSKNKSNLKSHLRYIYRDPAGEELYLTVDNKPLTGCKNTNLPISYNQVKWARLIHHELANRIDKELILQGTISNNRINVSEIIVPVGKMSNRDEEKLSPILLNHELFPNLTISTFGAEQRASIKQNKESITLTCRSGDKFAGLLMRLSGSRLPQGIETQLNLKYTATHQFSLSVLDSIRRKNENPLHLAILEANNRLQQKPINIPFNSIDSTSELSWSLHCPENKSQLKIESIQLQAVVFDKNPIRGIWVWDPEAWSKTPDHVIQKIKSVNAQEVYISIPIDIENSEILQIKALKIFIARAKKQGIAVWAVEGDPHAVLHDKRPIFIKRAKILAAYNTATKEESRLRGIQYDIEPYLLAGYTLDEPTWIDAYVKTITDLSQASSLPIDIVIPFWWDSQQYQGEYFLNALTRYIERITIMNYRTDSAQLRQFAEPFLLWAIKQKRKTRIALELGPIADEQRLHYQSSKEGTLWIVSIENQYILLETNKSHSNPYGKQFQLSRESIAHGNNISFYGSRKSAFRLLPQLNENWIPYPSYDGISLHGL